MRVGVGDICYWLLTKPFFEPRRRSLKEERGVDMDRPPVEMEFDRFFPVHGAVEYQLEYTVQREYYVEYMVPGYGEPEIYWEYHRETVTYHLYQYLDQWYYLAPETVAEAGDPAAAASPDGNEEEVVEVPDQRRSRWRTILSRLRALFCCCCATEEE